MKDVEQKNYLYKSITFMKFNESCYSPKSFLSYPFPYMQVLYIRTLFPLLPFLSFLSFYKNLFFRSILTGSFLRDGDYFAKSIYQIYMFSIKI